MDDPHIVELSDEETSILLDATNWYADEKDISEHGESQLDKCADTIEDDSLMDITDVEKSVILTSLGIRKTHSSVVTKVSRTM